MTSAGVGYPPIVLGTEARARSLGDKWVLLSVVTLFKVERRICRQYIYYQVAATNAQDSYAYTVHTRELPYEPNAHGHGPGPSPTRHSHAPWACRLRPNIDNMRISPSIRRSSDTPRGYRMLRVDHPT